LTASTSDAMAAEDKEFDSWLYAQGLSVFYNWVGIGQYRLLRIDG